MACFKTLSHRLLSRGALAPVKAGQSSRVLEQILSCSFLKPELVPYEFLLELLSGPGFSSSTTPATVLLMVEQPIFGR